MQSNIPRLHRTDCKANNQTKVHDLLQFGLSVRLVVQNEALAHHTMLMALVLSRHEDRQYEGSEFTRDVFHAFAIWAACINTFFTFEVSPEHAIFSVLTPPVFVILRLLFLHPFEKLGE